MVKNRPKWWLPVAEIILGGIILAEGMYYLGGGDWIDLLNMQYASLIR